MGAAPDPSGQAPRFNYKNRGHGISVPAAFFGFDLFCGSFGVFGFFAA